MWAVVREDQGLCGWSWVMIRAYVSRLARDQVEKCAKPEREGDLSSGPGPHKPHRPHKPPQEIFQLIYFQIRVKATYRKA